MRGELPITLQDRADLLERDQRQVFQDGDQLILMEVLEHRAKGTLSPLPMVEQDVRAIVLNQRKLQLLERMRQTYTVKHLTDRISAFIERLALVLFAMLPLSGEAQPTGLLIDRVVGVVGREAILHSDLMGRMEQATQGGPCPTQTMICGELEDLLYEKLLVEQGRLDSVVVEQGQVDLELDRRIRYFSQQLGGDEKLEAFYGKSVTVKRDDFRPQVHDQLLVQTMQQRLRR